MWPGGPPIALPPAGAEPGTGEQNMDDFFGELIEEIVEETVEEVAGEAAEEVVEGFFD